MGGGRTENIAIDRMEILRELREAVEAQKIDINTHVKLDEIAELLGVSKNTIAVRARKKGIEIKKWHDENNHIANVVSKEDALRLIRG